MRTTENITKEGQINRSKPLVRVEVFSAIGNDERGRTDSFCLPRMQDEFLFLTRRAGTISGNTYHQGKNLGTSPKTFLLLDGEIKFSYRHIEESEVIKQVIKAPAKIEVEPFITHQVEVLKDCILLECNSIANITEDRTREPVNL